MERRFVGEIHRKSQQYSDRKRNLLRHYSCLDNAVEKLTGFMLKHGKVGDVCEVHHKVTGMQLGTIKMTLQGRLLINWVWEQDNVA